MTDLNKLRSEFEALPEIKPHLDHGNVQWSEEYKTYVSDFKSLHIVVCYVRGAWFGWQEKAKARAVPEGYCLVPKEPTPKMIDATWDFDDEIHEMSSNTRNEFIWKKMVEVASESGAEG